MINKVHEMTRSGRIKRPSYSAVATWVKQSWEDIDVELIKTSFKCCGISLAGDDQERANGSLILINYTMVRTLR